MVRHPHFTQPIFVRFPRPAVMRGRDGVERWPQAAEVGLEMAVTRSLRELDPSVTLAWVKDVTGLYEPDDILRARNATLRERPSDVKRFFAGQFKSHVPVQPLTRTPVTPLRPTPADDPYGI